MVRTSITNTEAANDFQLGLTIRPVGLTYEKPHRPFTRLMVRGGEPIPVADFTEAYRADPRKASEALTARLTEVLGSLIINVDTPEQDQLLYHLEEIAQNEESLAPEVHFQRAQSLLSKIKALPGDEQQSLFAQAEEYAVSLRMAGTTDRAVHRGSISWGPLLALVMGFPLFVYGWLNHLIQWYLPRWVLGRMNPDVSYRSTVQWLLNLVLFPILWAIQAWVVGLLFGPPWSWIYLGSLLVVGPLAVLWHQGWLRLRAEWSFLRLDAQKKQELDSYREGLLNWINAVEKSYL